jgi:hypothetical protein
MNMADDIADDIADYLTDDSADVFPKKAFPKSCQLQEKGVISQSIWGY